MIKETNHSIVGGELRFQISAAQRNEGSFVAHRITALKNEWFAHQTRSHLQLTRKFAGMVCQDTKAA